MKNKWKRSVFILPLTGAIALSPATSVLAEEVELEKQDQAWTQAETTETEAKETKTTEVATTTETEAGFEVEERVEAKTEAEIEEDIQNETFDLAAIGSLYELQLAKKAVENEMAIQGSSPELEAQLAAINARLASYATQAMYRLYNPNSGEHFYTANTNERDVLIKAGWKDEGIGWYAPISQGIPVYRLYNPNGEHHYTTSGGERDNLVSVGWKYEGEGWKSLSAEDVFGQPLYRQYNPNQKLCNHNYTTSLGEHEALIGLGWKDEGIGWTGVDVIYQENVNGNLRIYKTDTMEQIFGLYTYGGQCFYLDPANDGIALTNAKRQINGKYYLFNEQGQMIRSTGWVDFGGQRYWINDDGSLATGLVFVSKEQTGEASHYLVFDEQGSLVRNGQSGSYQADANGWLTNPNGDQMIKQFCHDTYAKTGRDLEQIFRYVGTEVSYQAKDPQWYEPAPGLTHTQYFAYVGFTSGKGNCYTYASMIYHLAKEAGYEARFVKGAVATASGNAEHGWVEIQQNGQWYICDGSMYRHYPISYTFMRPIDRAPFVYVRPVDAYNFQ